MNVPKLESSPSPKLVCAGILGAATLVIVPFLLRGYTAGHDTVFHIASWLEVAKQFRQGILHPRWAALAYYGYGEPAFIFYPPVSLYLGAVLTLLLPFRMVAGAYVWLVLVAAGFSFYSLCRRFFDGRASLLGAVVYILNPYHLAEVHARWSLAELLVSAFLPLLLLAIYRLSEPGRRSIAIAALLFAMVALTNVPLTVVSAYGGMVFVIALTLARKTGIEPVVKFVVAGVLGAGLAGFFLLPAWVEKGWVLSAVHTLVPPAAQFVRLTSRPYDHFGWALVGVEVGQIVLGCLAWALCWRARPRDAFRAFTAVFAASVLMVLPISAVIWRTAPALFYVQFPWRWLGPMGLALSFFIAAAVQQSSKGMVLAAGVCALGLATLAVFTVLINTKADVMLASLKRSVSEGTGYLGTPYFLPRDIKVNEVGIPVDLTRGEAAVSEVGSEVADGQPGDYHGPPAAAETAQIAITRWSANAREITVDTPQPASIRFRLFRYPGWYGYLDGRPIDTLTTDARGAVVVPVPSGVSRVRLVYQRTPDQMWGIVVSTFFLVIWLWMFFSGRSKEPSMTPRVLSS
jgi:6-pyruvoyl-tetrahydropterin synthase related domain